MPHGIVKFSPLNTPYRISVEVLDHPGTFHCSSNTVNVAMLFVAYSISRDIWTFFSILERPCRGLFSVINSFVSTCFSVFATGLASRCRNFTSFSLDPTFTNIWDDRTLEKRWCQPPEDLRWFYPWNNYQKTTKFCLIATFHRNCKV